MLLGLNLDHVATLRQARYRAEPESPLAEPDLVTAARAVLAGGANSLTIHTRADRRHMQPEDAFTLQRELPNTPLNLEMGVTAEMLELAQKLQPAFACFVPEERDEVTTEGGLDLSLKPKEIQQAIEGLQAQGTRVSLFIDPDLAQVQLAKQLGAKMIELHTGAFANAPLQADKQAAQEAELIRLQAAARLGHDLGLQVNAGHGLRLDNLPALAVVPHLSELNIGHSTIARSLFLGLESAVAELRALIDSLPWASK